MTGSETGLHSGEGTVGFEMVSDLFINVAFEDFRKAGQDGYREEASDVNMHESKAFSVTEVNK